MDERFETPLPYSQSTAALDAGTRGHNADTHFSATENLDAWFLGDHSSAGTNEQQAHRRIESLRRDRRQQSRAVRHADLQEHRRVAALAHRTALADIAALDDDEEMSFYSGPKLAPGEDGEKHFQLIKATLMSSNKFDYPMTHGGAAATAPQIALRGTFDGSAAAGTPRSCAWSWWICRYRLSRCR